MCVTTEELVCMREQLVKGALSGEFKVKRGAKQGSVLSPTLFLLIMLQQLKASRLHGLLSIVSMQVILHDNIRTTVETLEVQVSICNA